MTAYAELQITSNFSFLRGGSHPEELVLRAAELGLSALALTDRNTLAGVVRAHIAAKEVGIRFVVGARLDLMPEDGADRSSAMKAATDSEDPSRSTAAAADSGMSSPGILGFDPALGSERDGDPCLSSSADVAPARSGKPQLDLRTRQARPQTNDVASDHDTAPRPSPEMTRKPSRHRYCLRMRATQRLLRQSRTQAALQRQFQRCLFQPAQMRATIVRLTIC